MSNFAGTSVKMAIKLLLLHAFANKFMMLLTISDETFIEPACTVRLKKPSEV